MLDTLKATDSILFQMVKGRIKSSKNGNRNDSI